MEVKELLKLYKGAYPIEKLMMEYRGFPSFKGRLRNGAGSQIAMLLAQCAGLTSEMHIAVLSDREDAAYFYNDLSLFLGKSVQLLPSSYRRVINSEEKDTDAILVRTELFDLLRRGKVKVLVTYPEALAERVVSKVDLDANSMILNRGDSISMSKLEEYLYENNFERCDFVYEPGQFSVRGGIIDLFSFSEEQPVRIEFFGDEIDSIRVFDVESQLSDKVTDQISIVPDMSEREKSYTYTDIMEWLSPRGWWWIQNGLYMHDRIKSVRNNGAETLLTSAESILAYLRDKFVLEWGPDLLFRGADVDLRAEMQPVINKKFEILADTLRLRQEGGYKIYICSTNEMQINRIRDIFRDMRYKIDFTAVKGTIHEGFVDRDLKCCFYTEHQIFDRYHKYHLQASRVRKGRETMSISELQNLHPGDYVVHVDHGIGRFGGLTKVEAGGRIQEAIRLVYKNNAELFIGLHSLHKIAKYKGKDGEPPAVHKLGGDAWNRLKQKTKSKVKDIARELIALYAKRKMEPAFAYSPDSYLQDEMEASFIYEETPDQLKAIEAVKNDMQRARVMDRLVCGDVGFGKTEVAMRAAFKAVCDGKQVAVLVPTTVLAFQHYNSFKARLHELPCRVDYISRMRKNADIKKTLKDLKEGKVDIIIGTHRLTGKDVEFKDLGLLIIDEEQKFGVSVKEKLKRLKLNVDTLTMTATPIPRTLQFSLMGARDMSIIRTPPPNRYPIVTELHRFDDDLIREAIQYEVSRGGQVFFIHNRVDTIYEVQVMLGRLLPKVKSVVAHGQMPGEEMEQVMHDFMRGDYDVLIATTIIESGLDIPNANTIIINQAQNYGLSDLHQLRGRVGRSNRKAFCYLLTPPLDMVNPDSRRRLKAIEDFSGLGSGFNIAMQDLDIRGAGNILGAEQSGFIAEIGYETYQRILNEAIRELRTEEFPELEVENQSESDNSLLYLHDCVVETDLEVHIPEYYVENTSERVKLYRELDSMRSENELKSFAERLVDRFGAIPEPCENMMNIVRIRWMCGAMGVERLLLRNGKMTLYFVTDSHELRSKSEILSKIVRFVAQQICRCALNQKGERLSLSFVNIDNMQSMYTSIESLYRFSCEDSEKQKK